MQWTLTAKDGIARVVLEGEITQDADFSRMLAELPDELVFDLASVRRINSSGVHRWINFVQALKQSGKRFALEQCSVAVVRQLNLLPIFSGGAEVRSVQAPYFCTRCDEVQHRLITLDDRAVEQINAPFPCPKCGELMEFDDLLDEFLAFRQGARGASPR